MMTITASLTVVGLSMMSAQPVEVFVSAQPVWLAERETEMNVFAGFRAVAEASENTPATVRVTASTLYRLFVNGDFVGYGPARGPHHHYRVDTWTITLRPGRNIVAFEVAGYNANSYYVLDQPSFLQAEVLSGDAVLAATGDEARPFVGMALPERIQKVQRYSFQRPFLEAYRLGPDHDAWRNDAEHPVSGERLTLSDSKALLPRGVPYPRFEIQQALQHVASGAFTHEEPERPFRDRSLTTIGPKLKGYTEDELEIVVSARIEEALTSTLFPVDAPLAEDAALTLDSGTFHIVDLGTNLSGFPRLQVVCDAPMRLAVTWDEVLTEGDVNWRRLACVNALLFDLEPGTYVFEGFEAHTMRYMKLMALSGSGIVSDIGLRRYEHPGAANAVFTSASDALNRIFEAGRTTFAQNAVDIPMDCPHRERAGWLCDSFFIARAELALSGDIAVERNFMENFLLPKSFAHLPDGMLPMCYPADHYDGVFIPNWSLWFVVQLGEFARRSPDAALIQSFKPRVEALFNYFSDFLNEDGLLEKLESWVFVEWSAANNFVQDVNYPSNMLYAAALDVAADLFDEDAWRNQAAAIRAVIREQALGDLFFVDNALRSEDGLVLTDNMSEVCQYYAFYFDVATPESDPELWRVLLDEFGPDRQERGAHAEVHPANAFIGNMLRFELLSRAGRAEQLVRESQEYLLYMVERTGTLWENMQDHASLNHGFASHIVVTLFRDVLGAWRLDPVARELHVRLTDTNLEWCGGELPVADQRIIVQWRRSDETIQLYVETPPAYTITIENMTDLQLTRTDAPVL